MKKKMMASFNFFRLNKFPAAPTSKGTVILPVGEVELNGKTATTKMIFKASSVYDRFERYQVYHECRRYMSGRTYEGDDFDWFYEKSTFDAFVDRQANLMMCNAPKRFAKNFVDVLNERKTERFNADYLRLNFSIIKPRMQDVRGIWFNRMAQPNLEVAAFFGPNVDKSDFYRAAEAIGVASSFLVAYDYQDTIYPIIISASYGISFLRPDAEAVHFALVAHIQQHLLTGAISNAESKFNERRRKQQEREAAKIGAANGNTVDVAGQMKAFGAQ